jgi:sporulation protein YlmC with PRC-barrel domain
MTMLRSALEIRGYRIRTTDGEIGKAHDLYFDDAEWRVRYLVVDTGRWLPGRRVLVSPVSLGRPDWSSQVVPVTLNCEQIEKSPPVAADEPVSRQLEHALVTHFGWPMYWAPPSPTNPGAAGTPPISPAPQVEREQAQTGGGAHGADPHLRSLREVTGYSILAQDGEVGHVEDFVIDDEAWAVRYIVVDTRNWLPGRRVILAPHWFEAFDWQSSKAIVELSRQTVKESPHYDPDQPVNRDYEGHLYDYYGRPAYWSEAEAPTVSRKV